jgi:hypothetical protein
MLVKKKKMKATPKEQPGLLFWHHCTPHNEKNTPHITTHPPKWVCGTLFEVSLYWWQIVEHWGLVWLCVPTFHLGLVGAFFRWGFCGRRIMSMLVFKTIREATPKEQLVLLFWHHCTPHNTITH